MDNERFSKAFNRLEAVIGRLEAIGHGAPDERVAALEARNRRLRDGAREAIERIDRLIGATPGRED